MNQKFTRSLTALILAAVFVLAMPGCAARTLIDAVANGLSSQAPESSSAAPAESAAAPTSAATPAATTPSPTAASTSLAAPDNASESAARMGILVPFPQMQYERPDIDAITSLLGEIEAQMEGQTNPDTASALAEQAISIYDAFETETVLAMIHYSMDRSDRYWSEEYSFCADGSPRVNAAYTAVRAAFEESPAGGGMQQSENMFEASGVMELLQENSRITNQYLSMLSTVTASYGGETFTYLEADTADKYAAWLDTNARTMGELYVNLLKIRRQLAQAVGYENYIEYVFATRGSGFTQEMVEQLLNQIAARIVPVRQSLEATEEPHIEVSEAVLLQAMHSWMQQLDPSMEDSLNLMEDYLLYDFSVGSNKDPVAFTTYLPSYEAPFLMASFTGDYSSVEDVLHEFGHFNNYACDPSAYTQSSDIGEVFSTALPLLCARFFEGSFGADEGRRMLTAQMRGCLDTFTYQAYFAGFELAAYALPDDQITYENLCAISQDQWYRFGQADSPIAATDWTTTTHLVDSPFYVLSYIIATDVAMQIWERSLSDPQGAMDVYYDLMQNAADGMSFMDNIESAGLMSPFTDYEAALQAAYFTAILIAGQTPQEARAAHLESMGQTAPPTPVPTEAPTPDATQEPEAVPPDAADLPDLPRPSGSSRTFFGFSDGNYTIPLD